MHIAIAIIFFSARASFHTISLVPLNVSWTLIETVVMMGAGAGSEMETETVSETEIETVLGTEIETET